MPSILVVGADHLGNMPEHLAEIGFDDVVHMSGRKCQMVRKGIPDKVDAVLVLTDYVNHNLTKVIKQQAKLARYGQVSPSPRTGGFKTLLRSKAVMRKSVRFSIRSSGRLWRASANS